MADLQRQRLIGHLGLTNVTSAQVSLAHLRENLAAAELELPDAAMARRNAIV